MKKKKILKWGKLKMGKLEKQNINLHDFSHWNFKPPLTEESSILCPKCEKYTKLEFWETANSPCEDCGDHDAIKCPKCGERFDMLEDVTFKTKRFTKKRKKLQKNPTYRPRS